MYQKGDAKLYDEILARHNQVVKEKNRLRDKTERAWSGILSKNAVTTRVE